MALIFGIIFGTIIGVTTVTIINALVSGIEFSPKSSATVLMLSIISMSLLATLGSGLIAFILGILFVIMLFIGITAHNTYTKE